LICGLVAATSPMQKEMQEYIDSVGKLTGYKISVGYKNKDMDFGIGSGSQTGKDTMLMGSGTKPFTAVSVLRLVDQGKVNLEDKASIHIDGPMTRMWGTTFVGLFGDRAKQVTVGQLIRMRSGINDFDTKEFNSALLLKPRHGDIILNTLTYVANLKGPLGCKHHKCTW